MGEHVAGPGEMGDSEEEREIYALRRQLRERTAERERARSALQWLFDRGADLSDLHDDDDCPADDTCECAAVAKLNGAFVDGETPA